MMQGVLLLAGYTSRSIAYVQAMIKSDIQPEYTYLYGEEQGRNLGQTSLVSITLENTADIIYPDYSISLTETLSTHHWHYKRISANHIKNKNIHNLIERINPSLVIYSGYGSQIVPKSLLDLGTPFLHLHSGWLPKYRGSTTLYYSLLIEKDCAVSAIILDEGIDTGPIIARKKYPPPPDGVDPDHIYDPAIRADLLVEILQKYSKHGKFNNMIKQGVEGKTYFVIHPVLKHLARLQNL